MNLIYRDMFTAILVISRPTTVIICTIWKQVTFLKIPRNSFKQSAIDYRLWPPTQWRAGTWPCHRQKNALPQMLPILVLHKLTLLFYHLLIPAVHCFEKSLQPVSSSRTEKPHLYHFSRDHYESRKLVVQVSARNVHQLFYNERMLGFFGARTGVPICRPGAAVCRKTRTYFPSVLGTSVNKSSLYIRCRCMCNSTG